jgi:transcription elongation factor GreA
VAADKYDEALLDSDSSSCAESSPFGGGDHIISPKLHTGDSLRTNNWRTTTIICAHRNSNHGRAAKNRPTTVSEHDESTKLADEARDRVAAELVRLRQRRDRLEIEVLNDRGMVGDHGDAADAIQRADELAGLDDRISELDRLLLAGPSQAHEDGTLPDGTEVTLRFTDGAVVTMLVISVVEQTPVGREGETLTARSPLGLALAGHQPGDTVTYSTPQGQNQVELLELKYPR